MEADFWHERWGSGRTRFDQANAHPLLREHWVEQIGKGDGAVFVPLCGKSIDMEWLAAAGHRVIGSELSPIAVADFFAARHLVPEVRDAGELSVYANGPYELWCGDFFELPAAALADVAAVYDRASLVALPTEMRRRYVAHLREILPEAVIFLITFEFDPREMDGPPFPVTSDEVERLYGDAYDIDIVVRDDVLSRSPDLAERGLTRLSEALTILRPRP